MRDFERPDFHQLLTLVADTTKSRIQDHHLQLNASSGKGFAWVQQLPSGISVMVSDTSMKEDMSFKRLAGEDHFFSLQFTEQSVEPGSSKRFADDVQSYVKLSHTLNEEVYSFPANINARTVAFFFNKDHLSHLLGRPVMEEMLTQYFPLLIQNNHPQPIATEYRMMLDELLVEKIQHPLRVNYIQNRVLMLLENFIQKQLQKRKAPAGKKVKRSDDETIRLMKVESLLVKNFEKAPPTIDELSRISAMSPTKLKNDFKALYGLPIYEYYQKNRMNKAKSLLMLGKYSIKEVGIMVGYSNLSHFANTFKKEFGHLPSEIAARDGVLVYNS